MNELSPFEAGAATAIYLCLMGLAAFAVVTWIAFPFIIRAKMDKQIKEMRALRNSIDALSLQLASIDKNTEAVAVAFDGRRAEVDQR